MSRLVGGDNIVGTASDTAPGEIWAYSKIFSDNCAALQNKTGNFLGTAFVARDMMQVVDALDEDGMIRYLGMLSLLVAS